MENENDDDGVKRDDDIDYQPAPDSPTIVGGDQSVDKQQDEDDDPLDSFMADIDQQVWMFI